MFNKIKSIFRSRTPPKQKVVKARFDAAQTTTDNHRHWAAADHLSADMEASPEVRRTLRQRARYEVANNSYAKGLVQMLANDTIGTGPRLQMLSSSEDFNDEVETSFMHWADAVHLPSKLRTMRMARCQDGEAFAVLATNPKVRHPVKLDLMLVEADRISGDLKWLEDDRSVDGITFDQWGNPLSYRVLKYHPGDIHYMPGDEAVRVPAEFMIHIFRQDRPGLHRGVPELTAALPLFAQLRRYNLAVLSAAEAAADSSRSQRENRLLAISGLRRKIAYELRAELSADIRYELLPEPSKRNPARLLWAARILDVLAVCCWEPKSAAPLLKASTSRLTRILYRDPDLWQILNRERVKLALPPWKGN
mgnify:CR=1 FL=1